MSFWDSCCLGCLGGEPVKKTVFVIGKDEDKMWFLEQFGINESNKGKYSTKKIKKMEQDDNSTYQEYSICLNSTVVIFSFVSSEIDDPNVEEIHLEASVAVVVLNTTDEMVDYRKPTFYIYMSGKTKLLSNGNFIVLNDKDNVKSEFEKFIVEY